MDSPFNNVRLKGDLFLAGFSYRIIGHQTRVRYHNTLPEDSLTGSSGIIPNNVRIVGNSNP